MSKRAWAPCLATLLALVWLARARWPGDWDAVGFVLAVDRWDLARFRPHPPGYPLYVLLARAVSALGGGPTAACVGASMAGALVLCLPLLRQRSWPWTLGALLACPVWLERACAVGADLLGAGLLLAALGSLASGSAFAAGALGAWCLAARPTLLLEAGPALLCALLAWRPAASRALLVRSLAGALLASLPVLWWVSRQGSLAQWVALSLAQGRGHFTQWGGTPWQGREGSLPHVLGAARALREALGGAGAQGWLRAAAWLLAAAWGLRGEPSRVRRAAWAAGAALALTTLVAQNASSPRHWLLPSVLAVVAGARGLSRLPRRPVKTLLAVLLCACAMQTFAALRARRALAPAGMQLALALRARHGDADVLVAGGREARYAELVGYEVLGRDWPGELETLLARRARWPGAVYVTSEMRSRERLPLRFAGRYCGPDGCLEAYAYVPPTAGSWWLP